MLAAEIQSQRQPPLLEREEVAGALGHLIVVQVQVPIRAHGFGPHRLRENGSVVVNPKRQVVLHQVAAAGAQVDGVPV